MPRLIAREHECHQGPKRWTHLTCAKCIRVIPVHKHQNLSVHWNGYDERSFMLVVKSREKMNGSLFGAPKFFCCKPSMFSLVEIRVSLF